MIAYILFNAVAIVIAFIGNFFVMLVAASNRLFHNMRSFLMVSMALGDFLLVITLIVPRLVTVAYKKWIFGESEELCQCLAFFSRILYLNTILQLCAVSYDRYRAIVKDHLTYDGRITPKKVIISISVLWILPTVISLGPFLGWGGYKYIPEIYSCGQRWDKQSTFPYLIMTFVAPLLFIFVLNCKIIKVARRLERQVNIQLGEINNEENGQKLQLDQFAYQSGINQQEYAAAPNTEARSSQLEEYQGREEDACQDPTELWKNTLRKAGQVNTGNEHSQLKSGAGCSQHGSYLHGNIILVEHRPDGLKMESDPEENEEMRNSDGTEKPTTHQFESAPASLAERQQHTLSSAVVQQRIPRNAKNIDKEGLMKILKECKAARDVMVIMGAFLVCFLSLWIHGIYRSIKGEIYSSEVLLWVNSFCSATTICNPIIYSIRKKEFKRAVRNIFKN